MPVANDIAYSITVVYRYSSQGAQGTDRPVLIWYAFHWLFKHALATQAASTALSSSLLLSGFYLACTSTSLGAISFPCLLPCSGLLLRQRLIHSTWRYLVPGATLLGPVLIWYTVNRLLQQTLLHKPLPFYGFVFVFLSYSSYSSYSPFFLFCSLAGFHLECTSNSLGATSLWPAGLPKAIK